MEWLLNQIFSLTDVIEDVSLEEEIPTVNSCIGTRQTFYTTHEAIIIHLDQVVGQARSDTDETGDFIMVFWGTQPKDLNVIADVLACLETELGEAVNENELVSPHTSLERTVPPALVRVERSPSRNKQQLPAHI